MHLSLGQIYASNYLSKLNLWAPDVSKTPARQRQISAGWSSLERKNMAGGGGASTIFSLTLLARSFNVILDFLGQYFLKADFEDGS